MTITYYSQGQGVGNQGSFVDQFTLSAGQSKTINVANKAPKGFVGSAWISSQNGIVVSASRVKSTMALTNTNVPSLGATTSPDNNTKDKGSLGVGASCTAINGTMCQMYAPLVYLDYNGWNTGFNVVNTSEVMNQVTINVVNRDGTSVGVYTAAIPAKGMQYVYIPASQDKGLGQGSFTAAILTANAPFAATVDEVKYTTGDAMSYNATATLAVAKGQGFDSRFFGDSLSLPLYQAGKVDGGVSHGDTSGINLFNPTGDLVSGRVDFYMSTGAAAGSTQIGGGTPFTLGGMSSALVAYAPSQANITPGSQLSAVVTVTGGKGGVVGVSNEVNYDVNGDGGVVFNMLNADGQYRYACSQTSCGSPVPPVTKFASKLTLEPATQSHLVGTDATVIATAYDPNGNPMSNVAVTLSITSSGTPSVTSPVKQKTDANGKVTLTYTNTTAGTDTVSATAKAPNGQTLASVPPSVKVIWTQPTLNVTVCTVVGNNCYAEPGDGTPANTTTVTADTNNIGAWKYTFTVTGVNTPSDLNNAKLHYAATTGNTFDPNENGAFGPSDFDGTWACASGTCTVSTKGNSVDITDRIGKSEVLNWYLDINGDGTQQGYEPSAGDNPTTVNYVAPAPPALAVSVTSSTTTPPDWFAESAQPADATTSTTATVVAYPATLTNTSVWDGNWTWTFTVSNVSCADLQSGKYLVAYQVPAGSGTLVTEQVNQLSTWQQAGSTCTATASASGIDVTNLMGTDSVAQWSLVNSSDNSNYATGNQTTLHFVGLQVWVSGQQVDGTWSTFAQTAEADDNHGPSWKFQFVAYGFTSAQLQNALLQYHYFPQNSHLGAQNGSYGPSGSSATRKSLGAWSCDTTAQGGARCTAVAQTTASFYVSGTIPANADWYLDLNADGNRDSTTEPIGDQTQLNLNGTA